MTETLVRKYVIIDASSPGELMFLVQQRLDIHQGWAVHGAMQPLHVPSDQNNFDPTRDRTIYYQTMLQYDYEATQKLARKTIS